MNPTTYQPSKTYDWNYDHPPEAVPRDVPPVPGRWDYCGRPVASPLAAAAGPLLNGAWCLYYAALGFDVVTYKTVRSTFRACYPLPNLQPVACGSLFGGETQVPTQARMERSWAVSFGMPSKSPDVWRRDVEQTRQRLPSDKILSVSVVGTVQPGWSIEQLGADYATCARWARESGADCIEANFSCPNVSTCDGQLYQHPRDAALVAEQIRHAIGRTPLIIKVGHLPSSELAQELVEALEPHVDALAMTNSIAVQVVTPDGQPLFDGQRRGICGRATFEASVAQTRQVAEVIRRRRSPLKVFGVGGIFTAQDVLAYLDAGAHAVQIATALMLDPYVGIQIREELRELRTKRTDGHDA